MAEPIIDLDRACVLESGQKIYREPITSEDVFNVNGRCIIRQEVDTYLVCLDNRFECMSQEGFEFIKLLKSKHDFMAKEIAEVFGFSEAEILQVFERFLLSGILLKS